MSKRFGRNQRRAMRETIAAKDRALDGAFEEIDRQRALTKRAWERASQMEDRISKWASRIHAMVGPGSAFNLDPSTREVTEEYFEFVAAGRPHRLSPTRPLSPADMMTNRPVPVDTAQWIVEAFACTVERHENPFAMRQIVELRTPDGLMALALDEVTYRELLSRDPGYLVRYFHERLMAALLAPKKPAAARGRAG